MMQPTVERHTCRGNQQVARYPTAQYGVAPSSTELWGAHARILTGAFQIIFGIIEVILGIIIVVELYIDFGLGIFCGVFAISAGCLGLFSKQSKGLIIAYMVLSIVAAVLCGICIMIRIANLASIFVVISCLVTLFQGIVSIIGASFTCGALSNTQTSGAVQVVQQCPQQPSAPPLTDPPPPYTVVTAYPGTTQYSYDQQLPVVEFGSK